MELKKFEAPTLADALKVVKKEFGPEAVILSTKNVRSGLGLLNKPSVVVTAAISSDALKKKRRAEGLLNDEQKELLANKPSSKTIQAYDLLSGNRLARSLKNSTQESKNMSPPAEIPSQNIAKIARPLTQRRYIDIRDDDSPAEQAGAHMVDQVRVSQKPVDVLRDQRAFRQMQESAVAKREGPGLLQQMIALLIEAGIQDDLVKELGDELKLVMLRDHINRPDLLKLQLARIVMARVRVARPLGERLRTPSTPRIISFVGPTGVGKTTTVAKMAAELVITRKHPVTLATTDTFKIGAVEQLQTYANILNIPLEVCSSPDSFKDLESRLGPDDVVLVDTAGYGPMDQQRLGELRSVLSESRMETHLCVSATTRDSDLREIVRRFAIFESDYLVFTKLDETTEHGNLFNTCVKSHLPLSYFTMGQRVPEDMEVATKERLVDLLLDISEGS